MSIIYAGLFFIANWLVPIETVKMDISIGDETVSFLRISDTSWNASYYEPHTPPNEMGEIIINGWEVIFYFDNVENIFDLEEYLKSLENLDWETVDSFQPVIKEITSPVYIIREENKITLTQKKNPIFEDPVIIKYYFE